MANKITGSTDTTGAVSVLTGKKIKSICIVGVRGTNPAATDKKIFDVLGSSDAATKWGATAPSIELVKVLVANGVPGIKGIMAPAVGEAPAPTTLAEAYELAFDELLKETGIDIIIVDTTDSTVLAKLKSHLALADQLGKKRYAVVGTTAGADNATLATFAGTVADRRIFTAGPSVTDDDAVALSGIYSAAGLASAIALNTADPALPINGVIIKGFNSLDRVLLEPDTTALVAAGITPLVIEDGNITVYRLVTTSTDAIWKEGTTTMIDDEVMTSVIARLKANYRRTKNVTRILGSIRTDVIDVLETLESLERIENFDPNTVTVVKDPEDVYGALIDYTFDVVTPLYTLTITQHIKL